jgi:hypothetical protein
MIILSVNSNMLFVTLLELPNSLVYSLNAARFTHLLGGIIGVASSTIIPVTLKRLRPRWKETLTPLFCDADEKIADYPKLVSHGNTIARPDLELH